MHFLLSLLFCLLFMEHLNVIAVEAFDYYDIQNDLTEFNITCNFESCENYDTDSLSSRSCHCGKHCVQFGTCCLASYYADAPQPKLKPECQKVYNGYHYFIVNQCPSGNVWETLCNWEWNKEDDMQKLAPVTSLLTSITYKNYYCLRCHESTDEFLYWNVHIESDFAEMGTSEYEFKQTYKSISLIYHKAMDTWMAIYDENIGYFPVNITVKTPDEVYKLVHYCEPDIISDCPENWSDEKVRDKCHSYMAEKRVLKAGSFIKYKNIHCALCNFESLDDISCKVWQAIPLAGPKFSFAYLLDINRSDGELVGKIEKCSEDHIWDPFTKKCRKLSCALPGFKVVNGKCVEG